jgi:hypothetical protein
MTAACRRRGSVGSTTSSAPTSARGLVRTSFRATPPRTSSSPARRSAALVWTDERIERWLRTGQRPSPVMVWTPEQTGLFLDFVAEDRHYALWHLIAYRGLRRGEACSLNRSELSLTPEGR